MWTHNFICMYVWICNESSYVGMKKSVIRSCDRASYDLPQWIQDLHVHEDRWCTSVHDMYISMKQLGKISSGVWAQETQHNHRTSTLFWKEPRHQCDWSFVYVTQSQNMTVVVVRETTVSLYWFPTRCCTNTFWCQFLVFSLSFMWRVPVSIPPHPYRRRIQICFKLPRAIGTVANRVLEISWNFPFVRDPPISPPLGHPLQDEK
jgi:hypothetical protein